MQISRFLSAVGLLLVFCNAPAVPPYAGKKVLFIDSYHEGSVWSDGITRGVQSVLTPEIIKGLSDEADTAMPGEGEAGTPEEAQTKNRAPTGIELRILRMDTKRNPSTAFKQQAALKAKAEIDSFKPDVVIASDDNASRYLIMPFYKDAELPFVFCGINWDASVYGYPYKNATGMVEIDLLDHILKHLKTHAKGERIGFIGTGNETDLKNAENYQKVFKFKFAQLYFAPDFATWQKNFLRAQTEVDMLIVSSHEGINDWNEAEAIAFVEANTKIPAGTSNNWGMPYAVLGIANIPDEQGIWAAETALKILDGVNPAQIPIVNNKQGHLMLNLRLADKLGITFKPSLLKLAEIIR